MLTQSKPIAVLISDIHFTPSTLELASQALMQASTKAKELQVPLVLAGDTLDSKAIIRAECSNRLIEILKHRDPKTTHVLVGNHDLINEKGKEHSLNFLSPYCDIKDYAGTLQLTDKECYAIPYKNNSEEIKDILKHVPKGSILICHQGIMGADMGHYVKDRTSLPTETFDGLRVISGHYHKRQDIKCGKTGLFSYIGNPYTISFSEAEDPVKGFQILNSDGTLTFVPTNLRKHVIIYSELKNKRIISTRTAPVTEDDLVWVKLTGIGSEISAFPKEEIGKTLVGHNNFKLELIPKSSEIKPIKANKLTNKEILDTLIDTLSETPEKKESLKALWRDILNVR